jgi:hypothetical protein
VLWQLFKVLGANDIIGVRALLATLQPLAPDALHVPEGKGKQVEQQTAKTTREKAAEGRGRGGLCM